MKPTGSDLTFVNWFEGPGMSLSRIRNCFIKPFCRRIAYSNACTGVFVLANRSFWTLSYDIFAANRSRINLVSSPLSMQLVHVKFSFTRSSLSPQSNCSRVFVFPVSS